MKNKIRLLTISFATLLGLLGSSVPAMAATPDVLPETSEKEESTVKEEAPITPDGNLTLVDDLGEHDTSGKQFITLVTRDGNFFYLIIDRDDNGKETVHFLNQVDEADLFALLDEEELEALEDKTSAESIEKEILVENLDEVLPEETVKEPEKEKSFPIGAVVSGMVVVGGCVGFAVLKTKEKKKQQEKKDEPEEEEEYYEFLDLEQELNGEGLDDEESI